MQELLDIIKKSPIWFLLIALGYFAKLSLEKQIEGVYSRVDEISKTSLSIKEDLRQQERDALIDFRTKLETWEHHLFSGFTDLANADVSENSINAFYHQANELRLGLKISAATLGIVAQNEQIYNLAQDSIINIANTYEPLFGQYVPQMIDIQAGLGPINQRQQQLSLALEKGEQAPFSLEQLKADQVQHKHLNEQKTALVKAFYDDYLGAAKSIIETLTELKIVMSEQVYRPILTDQIDEQTSARQTN